MAMCHRLVVMPVTVPSIHDRLVIGSVRMLVMQVVFVLMFVLQRSMSVLMLVPLREVEPDAEAHK